MIRVLIVEDEILIAETIKLYLEQRSYKVSDICINYQESINALDNNPPDIALLDVRLYGQKSGIDIAHYINNMHRPIPFIYLTSQFDEQVLNLALETKPAGYLTKPIQKSTLYTTLKSVEKLHYVTASNSNSFSVFNGQSTQVLLLAHVLFVRVDHVYLEITLQDNSTVITRETLSMFASRVGKDFMQVHRSYLINLAKVKSWTKEEAILEGGHVVPVSRKNQADFREAMSRRSR